MPMPSTLLGSSLGDINLPAFAGTALASLFMGGGRNPAHAAMPYLSGISGSISPYLNPYMQAGQGALQNLQNQYGSLTSNPAGFLNQMGQGFKQSPGYQFQVDQATNAANRAAAAGGYLGSPQEQVQLGSTVNNLANQDYYNWLNNAMNVYGQGLQGEQGINQMGFMSNEDMAQALAQQQMQEANLAYSGQANRNEQRGGRWGTLLSAIGHFL